MASVSSLLSETPSTSQHIEDVLPERLLQTRARLEQIFHTIPTLPEEILVTKGKGRAGRIIEEGSPRTILYFYNLYLYTCFPLYINSSIMPPPNEIPLNGNPIVRRRRQLIMPVAGTQNILALVQRLMAMTRRSAVEELEANVHKPTVETEETEPAFDASGLKEVGNLASWTVSTFKPGCGVDELRSEDTNLFWQ